MNGKRWDFCEWQVEEVGGGGVKWKCGWGALRVGWRERGAHSEEGAVLIKNFPKSKKGHDMKKIPTLFKREFDEKGRIKRVLPIVTAGMEWVLTGEGEPTEKVDGSACAIIDGKLWKRYDAKNGKVAPAGAIPCQTAPDPVTGHWPHWVRVDEKSRADRWYWAAYVNSPWCTEDGTYEAVGVHFQGNPYGLDDDFLERHGRIKVKDFPRNFEGMREYLRTHEIEGVVFWKDGEPKCKIKRSDFGFPWNTQRR